MGKFPRKTPRLGVLNTRKWHHRAILEILADGREVEVEADSALMLIHPSLSPSGLGRGNEGVYGQDPRILEHVAVSS